MPLPILHSYFRSSTSFRVRIALNLKGIETKYTAHHVRLGKHRSEDYLAINPQGVVPSLDLGDGTILTQSLAIMEYLDESVPEPPLLPEDRVLKAKVRAFAMMIACDIHPVNNLKILNHLRQRFGAGDADIAEWFRHWVAETFAPAEQMLASAPERGSYCFGETPSMADICLAAQVVNNQRFDVDMSPYPVLSRIHETCMEHPAFDSAHPANQPDAE